MPVSPGAVADEWSTTPEGEPVEGSIPAVYAGVVLVLLGLLALSVVPRPGVSWVAWIPGMLGRLLVFRGEVRRQLSRVSARVRELADDGIGRVIDEAMAAAVADGGVTVAVDRDRASRLLVEALGAGHARVADALEDAYRRVVAAAVSADGDPGVAVQRVLDEVADRGVTGYVDASGRLWSLESYVETTVRAHFADAALHAYTRSLSAAGVRFVMVSRSEGSCKRCRPWEGRVLSIDSTPAGVHSVDGRPVVVAGTLAEARAAGLLHPWCRHRVTAWSPTRRRRLQPARVVDRARRADARYRHRQLRAWERRERVAITPRARDVARRKKAHWRRLVRDPG